MFTRLRRYRLATLFAVVTVAAIAMSVYHAYTRRPTHGYFTPQAAATAMLQAIATKNHHLFVQARMLGVCEGKNDWPPRFAETLHTAKFSSPGGGQGDLSVFDMPRRLRSNTVRVVSKQELTVPGWVGVSSYYGEQFAAYDMAIDNYDGVEFRTRLVVARVGEKWFAIPRRSQCSVYQIADALTVDQASVTDLVLSGE